MNITIPLSKPIDFNSNNSASSSKSFSNNTDIILKNGIFIILFYFDILELIILASLKAEVAKIKAKILLSKDLCKRINIRYSKRMVLVSNFLLAFLTFWSKFIYYIKVNKNNNTFNGNLWSVGGLLRYLIYKCLPTNTQPKSKLAAFLISSFISAFEDSSWFLLSAFLIWNESPSSEEGQSTAMSSWLSILGLKIWSDSNTVVSTKENESPKYHINNLSSELTTAVLSINSKPQLLKPDNKPKLASIFEAESHVFEEEANEASTKWALNFQRFNTDNKLDIMHAITSAFRPGVVGALLSGMHLILIFFYN